jgi:hypothetical protein
MNFLTNQNQKTIALGSEKTIVTVPQQTKTISSVTIRTMIDFPGEKKVVVRTLELGEITLWQGEEYDEVGQWTDADVENKIKELYS